MYARQSRVYQDAQLEAVPRIRVVVALYDRLLASIDGAELASRSGQIEVRYTETSRAVEIISALARALDFSSGGEIAAHLDRIYRFAIQRLTEFEVRNDPALAQQVRHLIDPLATAWRQLEQESAQASATNVEAPAALRAMRF